MRSSTVPMPVDRHTPKKAGDEVAFTIGGYLRGRGEHPTIAVGRDFDEDGNAIGHSRVGGATRLSDKHREVYDALPDEFRWKDLSRHFPGDRSKQLFRDACYGAGVLEHSNGTYRKRSRVSRAWKKNSNKS